MKIKTLENIDNIVNSYRKMARTAIVVCALLGICFMYFMYVFFKSSTEQVYVTRDYRVEKVVDKKAQIRAHTEMFYKLFFEVDQNNFKPRTEKALYLIGESGKDLRNRYAEAGWYNQLVQNNAEIIVDIDSVNVNDAIYPYEVSVSAIMSIRRESAVSKRYINSTFKVRDVNNSNENPFGLIIEKFTVTNNADYVSKN